MLQVSELMMPGAVQARNRLNDFPFFLDFEGIEGLDRQFDVVAHDGLVELLGLDEIPAAGLRELHFVGHGKGQGDLVGEALLPVLQGRRQEAKVFVVEHLLIQSVGDFGDKELYGV